MIPNILFFPTSSLNFNNIMACESISPAGFYPLQNFGYRRFSKVLINNFDNLILLYDKYPIFNIEDNELENYPIVIEIDVRSIGKSIIKEFKNGVYFSEETIYLNPFTTRIIFRNEKEKLSTFSKAEPSIETKMLAIYQSGIIVKSNDIEGFEWDTSKESIDLINQHNVLSEHISKDRIINKIKGFFYAYLLGANKSMSNEVVLLKKNTKDLKNVLTAVISRPDNQATSHQEEQLKELYQKINITFFRADKLSFNELDAQEKELKTVNLLEFLIINKLIEQWCKNNKLKPPFQVNLFNVSQNTSIDKTLTYLENYFSVLDSEIKKVTTSKFLKPDDLPTAHYDYSIETIRNEKEFLLKLINYYIKEEWDRESFPNHRFDFATAGGKLFKNEMKEKWENSSYQSYINDLRTNLISATHFSIKDTDNLTIKSFAAFCQKGDDDIYKLENYLISNEVGDFRIAFALWGVVFGFANMPKTLTNDLFLSNDTEYIEETYKYIFKQVHGIDLDNIIKTKDENPIHVSFLTIYRNSKLPCLQIEHKSNSDHSNYDKQNEKFQEKTPEYIQNKGINHSELLINNGETIDNLKRKNKTVQKAKKEKDKDISESNRTPPKKIMNQDSFDFNIPNSIEFYLDDDAYNKIKDILTNNTKLHDEVKKQIEWIQKVHKEGGYKKKSGKYISLKNHSNSKVIDHFKNNNKDRFEMIILDKLILKLKEIYP